MIAMSIGLIFISKYYDVHIKDSFCINQIFQNLIHDDFSNEKTTESRKDKPDGYGTYSRVDLSKSFAQLSLPHPLILQERGASKALGVTAKTAIKAYTQFGPLQGEHILLKDIPEDFEMKELWQVRNKIYTLSNRSFFEIE